VFIFATTVWTSFSLLPYRIFNICRIHLVDWNTIECDQKMLMNWLAWILIYLLTLNPIVNPFITAIIYAPYRRTLKKLLIKIPIGNRLHQYTYSRADTEATSYFSVRRNRTQRKGSGSTDQELSHLRPSLQLSEQLQRQSLNSSEAAGSSGGSATGMIVTTDQAIESDSPKDSSICTTASKDRIIGALALSQLVGQPDSDSPKSSTKSSLKSSIKAFIDDPLTIEEPRSQVKRSIAFQDETILLSATTDPVNAANGRH